MVVFALFKPELPTFDCSFNELSASESVCLSETLIDTGISVPDGFPRYCTSLSYDGDSAPYPLLLWSLYGCDRLLCFHSYLYLSWVSPGLLFAPWGMVVVVFETPLLSYPIFSYSIFI